MKVTFLHWIEQEPYRITMNCKAAWIKGRQLRATLANNSEVVVAMYDQLLDLWLIHGQHSHPLSDYVGRGFQEICLEPLKRQTRSSLNQQP